jgi:hypothetical protein
MTATLSHCCGPKPPGYRLMHRSIRSATTRPQRLFRAGRFRLRAGAERFSAEHPSQTGGCGVRSPSGGTRCR